MNHIRIRVKELEYNNIKDWFWYISEIIGEKLYHFMLWRAVKKLSVSCKLWELRGLPICSKHGFHAQSWITGKCYKCKEEKKKQLGVFEKNG